MPTDCDPALFEFPAVEGRRVVASFDGGAITSDAGALLLGQTNRAIRLTERFAACFTDTRTAELVEHQVETMVMQRVVGIALGYEDLNDHDHLRCDPVLAVLASKLEAQRSDCAPLAGKSTLNRLELSRAEPTRYHKIRHDPAAIEAVFVDLFLDAHKKAPKQIVLDLDATDDPLHGNQEGRFFHGYYDCYCYLPLYIFCGRHLLAAKLRRANADAAAGAVEEVARIVAQIRDRWPRTRILLRGDSGFTREALMACRIGALGPKTSWPAIIADLDLLTETETETETEKRSIGTASASCCVPPRDPLPASPCAPPALLCRPPFGLPAPTEHSRKCSAKPPQRRNCRAYPTTWQNPTVEDGFEDRDLVWR